MQTHTSAPSELFGGEVRADNGRVTVLRETALRSAHMDALVREAVFGQGHSRDYARWLIWEVGQAVGVRPASINDLYMARGRGEINGFTVPAIHVRGMAYDTARAIFRAAARMHAGAFILEIARSEIVHTEQRPAEFVAVVLAAALREGFRGPVFIQGNHFQISAERFADDPIGEVAAVKQLSLEANLAGFYNVDVDTSTLVDVAERDPSVGQEPSISTAVDIVAYIRNVEPNGVTVSIGAELGAIDARDDLVSECRAFLDGFSRALRQLTPAKTVGLSKIGVQTGAAASAVSAGESVGDIEPYLPRLRQLSAVARNDYGMAGASHHSASTLPDSAFHLLPRAEVAEIHLATQVQDLLYEHLPRDVRETIDDWLVEQAGEERKATESDEQFFRRMRIRALGPFKRRIWDLPPGDKAPCLEACETSFASLFEQLRIGGTADAVAQYVSAPEQHRRSPDALVPSGGAGVHHSVVEL